ncbi:MAG: tRNA (N6-isopentenyl adenosine(37)-C2)-methylthiotransferase MiaB [Alistipes sp.]|jgi:tRNA-2-methylthio-N6-dimethylallyladenosine synthase|nr:tRNA (N6-isopentenyl adenosine(37)-C2)-methylthiotransferase MiaB [Alistipes sp.]MCI6440488.1 tRNA (N6-isopentenyl adenosine(37)-C2)-methylthiotransferase MiaB [Alistipes sp.]MDD7711857.1 tRNA (N6-isopentenyl adenosine(37)-C2)-methylthiotransferase MiaB [Alistipes sp.]MDY3833936.1 tRNA (N6-isopentenyl adenosine(37)-C2)-methylthiotransferase MiaB [Candidatus Cryptobacteroides sp.]
MSKKIYIETYGCQMNVGDSEVIFSILGKEGYERTESMDDADVILANTCSVRDNAEQRIWGRIEVFHKQKEKRSGVVVGIVGCMAERLKDKLLDTHKVDLVAGPDSYRTLPTLLRDIAPDKPQINVMLSHEETYADIVPVRTDRNGVSAFISIMRGCNNVCSYCVVPYTRGAERSRDPQTIVDEARDVFSKGYKEVTLLGQNVDSYNWKPAEGKGCDFPELLEMVARISPELRVRFATNHPKDISDELIETMARYDNICNHIHLPVQSGSDRLLEKMRRRYTAEWYLERVAMIREVLPGCGITTDVIAGFCSETEEDHQQTLELFRKVGFDYAYMFYYSERPGTLAARHYPDDVPLDVKTRRLNEIIALQSELSLKSNQNDIGKTFRVLVEGPSKKNPEELCGRSGSNKMCVFPGKGHKAGDYVDVKVLSCTSATLIGKLA